MSHGTSFKHGNVALRYMPDIYRGKDNMRQRISLSKCMHVCVCLSSYRVFKFVKPHRSSSPILVNLSFVMSLKTETID